MTKKCLAVAVVAMAGYLLPSAASAGTITVGTPLPGTVQEEEREGWEACPEPTGCGVVLASTVAPSEGTVTSWHMQGASATPGYKIETLHPDGAGGYTITAASDPVSPAGQGLQTFTTDLPIAAGDYIGVVTPDGGVFPIIEGSDTVTFGFLDGPTGATAVPAPVMAGPVQFAFGFNAEITTPTQVVKEVVTQPVEGKVPAQTSPERHCVVPKLRGKTLAAAKRALRGADCKVGFVIRPHGVKAAKAKVKRTVPKPGTRLPLGTPVRIKLG